MHAETKIAGPATRAMSGTVPMDFLTASWRVSRLPAYIPKGCEERLQDTRSTKDSVRKRVRNVVRHIVKRRRRDTPATRRNSTSSTDSGATTLRLSAMNNCWSHRTTAASSAGARSRVGAALNFTSTMTMNAALVSDPAVDVCVVFCAHSAIQPLAPSGMIRIVCWRRPNTCFGSATYLWR